MSLFQALLRAGLLRPLDQALAQALQRLDPDTPDAVLAGAALASLAVSEGDAAFDPARAPVLEAWPAPADWAAAFAASRWVVQPGVEVAGPNAPLVFEHGLLYLRRYREYERRLAAGLRRIAARGRVGADLAPLAPLFAQLFPGAGDGRRDDGGQARAAALALLRGLLLVTGGPGTGKTTTLARLLALLLAQHRAHATTPLRIALAAPTGRAAERVARSMAAAIDALRKAGIDPALLDALPTQACTLHRLLGTVPDRPRFRHDAEHPLAHDVIVVDEASMVDLPLMCKLVDAVPDGATLVLVGDPDQLPSVEAGDVLAAIVQAAGEDDALPPAIEAQLAPLLGAAATAELFASANPAPVAGHRVHLRRGWRQSSALQLAPLAEAVREGDADAVLAWLRAGTLAGVHFHEGRLDPLVTTGREQLLQAWRAIGDAPDAAAALALAARVRLLTAVREGAQGANPLNARIEEALAGSQRERYFHGRLLLVTENSYRHQLFNGDIGVCLRAEGSQPGGRGDDGATVAWFPGGSDGVRGFHPAALPAHAGAFAMTVHKAQGSEFDNAWLVLPRQDVRSLSRELVYTAITRARSGVHVCAHEPVLRAALARHATRVSGLARRLQLNHSAAD